MGAERAVSARRTRGPGVFGFLLMGTVLAGGVAWLPNGEDPRWWVVVLLVFTIVGWRDLRNLEWRRSQVRGWREFWPVLGWTWYVIVQVLFGVGILVALTGVWYGVVLGGLGVIFEAVSDTFGDWVAVVAVTVVMLAAFGWFGRMMDRATPQRRGVGDGDHVEPRAPLDYYYYDDAGDDADGGE